MSERFEDLDAWKRARELCQAVYHASGPGAFERDFALRDQMRRAAISVLSNIAEGFERAGNKEFTQFLAIAKDSAGEVRATVCRTRCGIPDQGSVRDDAGHGCKL